MGTDMKAKYPGPNFNQAVSKWVPQRYKPLVTKAFSANFPDDFVSKTGFPYLLLAKVKHAMLLSDFMFALINVLMCQYAVREDVFRGTNEGKKIVKEMFTKGTGTLRCLLKVDGKKDIFGRTVYGIDSAQLKTSMGDTQAFGKLVDYLFKPVYENIEKNEWGLKGSNNDEKIKDLDNKISAFTTCMRTKAGRVTNWIVNGPKLAMAIIDLLHTLGIDTEVLREAKAAAEEYEQATNVEGTPGEKWAKEKEAKKAYAARMKKLRSEDKIASSLSDKGTKVDKALSEKYAQDEKTYSVIWLSNEALSNLDGVDPSQAWGIYESLFKLPDGKFQAVRMGDKPLDPVFPRLDLCISKEQLIEAVGAANLDSLTKILKTISETDSLTSKRVYFADLEIGADILKYKSWRENLKRVLGLLGAEISPAPISTAPEAVEKRSRRDSAAGASDEELGSSAGSPQMRKSPDGESKKIGSGPATSDTNATSVTIVWNDDDDDMKSGKYDAVYKKLFGLTDYKGSKLMIHDDDVTSGNVDTNMVGLTGSYFPVIFTKEGKSLKSIFSNKEFMMKFTNEEKDLLHELFEKLEKVQLQTTKKTPSYNLTTAHGDYSAITVGSVRLYSRMAKDALALAAQKAKPSATAGNATSKATPKATKEGGDTDRSNPALSPAAATPVPPTAVSPDAGSSPAADPATAPTAVSPGPSAADPAAAPTAVSPDAGGSPAAATPVPPAAPVPPDKSTGTQVNVYWPSSIDNALFAGIKNETTSKDYTADEAFEIYKKLFTTSDNKVTGHLIVNDTNDLTNDNVNGYAVPFFTVQVKKTDPRESRFKSRFESLDSVTEALTVSQLQVLSKIIDAMYNDQSISGGKDVQITKLELVTRDKKDDKGNVVNDAASGKPIQVPYKKVAGSNTDTHSWRGGLSHNTTAIDARIKKLEAEAAKTKAAGAGAGTGATGSAPEPTRKIFIPWRNKGDDSLGTQHLDVFKKLFELENNCGSITLSKQTCYFPKIVKAFTSQPEPNETLITQLNDVEKKLLCDIVWVICEATASDGEKGRAFYYTEVDIPGSIKLSSQSITRWGYIKVYAKAVYDYLTGEGITSALATGNPAPASLGGGVPAGGGAGGPGNTVKIAWRNDFSAEHLKVWERLFELQGYKGLLVGGGLDAYYPIHTVSDGAGGYKSVFSDNTFIKKFNSNELSLLYDIFYTIVEKNGKGKNLFAMQVSGFKKALQSGDSVGPKVIKTSAELSLNALKNANVSRKLRPPTVPPKKIIDRDLPAAIKTTKRTLNDVANRHLTVGQRFNEEHYPVGPLKGKPKTMPDFPPPLDAAPGEQTFDGTRRFYMTDNRGNCLRECSDTDGGYFHKPADPGASRTDQNNKVFFDSLDDKGKVLECQTVFVELGTEGTSARNYNNPADPADKGVYLFGSGDKAPLVDVCRHFLRKDPTCKILVVNLANEVTAGGTAGSTLGAVEESLVGQTSLLLSLTGGDMDEYYEDSHGQKKKSPVKAQPFKYNAFKFAISKNVALYTLDTRDHYPISITTKDEADRLPRIDVLTHASPNFNSDVTNQCPCETYTWGEEIGGADKARKALQDSANQIIKAAVQGNYDVVIIPHGGGGVFCCGNYDYANTYGNAIRMYGGSRLKIAFAIFDGPIKSNGMVPPDPILKPGQKVSELYTTMGALPMAL